jgi:hypothetical protein
MNNYRHSSASAHPRLGRYTSSWTCIAVSQGVLCATWLPDIRKEPVPFAPREAFSLGAKALSGLVVNCLSSLGSL